MNSNIKTIGGNEFFKTLVGAKKAAKLRGYNDGARIHDTDNGFCLLECGEGTSEKSYPFIKGTPVVFELRDGEWIRL